MKTPGTHYPEMKMQQTKSYWRLVAVAGIVSAFIGSACVVTTSTDDDNGGASNGGAGGAGTAGASTAGKAGANTAGANTAGSSAAGAAQGGSGTISFQCDPPGEGGAVGDANSCAPDMPGNKCQECIQSKCCTEYGACYATDPGNQCGWGGPAKLPNGDAYDGGEALCVQLCIQEGVKMSGTEPDAELKGYCANNCSTPNDTSGAACKTTIGVETNSLILCMSDYCSPVCFGPLPTP
jgi:hypothetical protein